ncbi:MAG: hypothetical protein AB7O39_11025 [Flavobacteriaceae bacterium]
MKPLLPALLALAISAPAAWADDCADRMAELHMQSMHRENLVVVVTTALPDYGSSLKDEFRYATDGDYMIMPMSDNPWTLYRGGVLYQSLDKGKSWKRLRSLDKAEMDEAAASELKEYQEQVGSIQNAVCRDKIIKGVNYETVQAEMKVRLPEPTEMRTIYQVSRADGTIVRSISLITSDGLRTLVDERRTPAPGLTLPEPE